MNLSIKGFLTTGELFNHGTVILIGLVLNFRSKVASLRHQLARKMVLYMASSQAEVREHDGLP